MWILVLVWSSNLSWYFSKSMSRNPVTHDTAVKGPESHFTPYNPSWIPKYRCDPEKMQQNTVPFSTWYTCTVGLLQTYTSSLPRLTVAVQYSHIITWLRSTRNKAVKVYWDVINIFYMLPSHYGITLVYKISMLVWHYYIQIQCLVT